MPASVLGTFAAPAPAAAAIAALRTAGFEVDAAMPAPYAAVEAALGRPASSLDQVTLPAALVGLGAGALLVAWTALDWPLRVGGQPVVALPPMVILGFEVAVLFGAVATSIALVARLRRAGGAAAFPAGSCCLGDRIAVTASGGDLTAAERLLRALGAEEVRRAG